MGAPEPVAPVAVAEGDAAVAASVPPAPLVVEEGARVLVFGDSWVYGSAATVPTLGFAYRLADELGVETVVDGVRGSGYLKPGLDGPAYGERIAALDPALDPDLIIVEGSINDRRLYPAGYRDAVTAAWDALEARYPDAAIVILGPSPQVLPVESPTSAIDTRPGGARRRARLVVHLTDRRGVDHHGQLPRRHRHRPDRSRPPLDGRPRLPRRPGRRRDRGDGAQPAIVADAPHDEDAVAP